MHSSLSFIINSKIRTDFPMAVVAIEPCTHYTALSNDKGVLVANVFPPEKNACCSSAKRSIYGEQKKNHTEKFMSARPVSA